VYFMKRKSEAKDRFVEFLVWVEICGWKVAQFNSDGGGEYTSNEGFRSSEFQDICRERKIIQQFTSAHTSAQNGISKRLNHTLVEHASCILAAAGLAKEFWSYAIKNVCWVRNRVWHAALRVGPGVGMSPHQRLIGRASRVAMVRVFGCNMWALNPKHLKGSFEPSGKKLVYLGARIGKVGADLTPRPEKFPRPEKLSQHFMRCLTRVWKGAVVQCETLIYGSTRRVLVRLWMQRDLQGWRGNFMTLMLISLHLQILKMVNK
jgi:hypothetical protein